MTEQEQQLISGLAERVKNAPAQQIDRDADNLIRTTVGSRPDALYILTQTVLVQEMAITQAKAQIDELKQKLAEAQQAPAPSAQAPAQSPQPSEPTADTPSGPILNSNGQGSPNAGQPSLQPPPDPAPANP